MPTRRLLLAFMAAAPLASAGSDDDKIWKEYLDWYRRDPGALSDPREAYLDYLRRSGIPDPEAQWRLRAIERLAAERRGDLHPIFFDRTYASATPRFNTEPNKLLVETVRERKPGRALDIHMGQGRNAIFLASRGWDVTGFDFSKEGVGAARRAAAKAGVRLNALARRHEDFDFGRERWDLVVMTYTWIPLRGGPYIGRIVESLKPGGLLVFEGLMDESGSERGAAWLPRPGELPHVFERLRILRYEDVRTDADWAWRPERVARLVACRLKPAAARSPETHRLLSSGATAP